MRKLVLAVLTLLVLAGCGGGGGTSGTEIVQVPAQEQGLQIINQQSTDGNLVLGVIKDASGVPIGVQIQWTRVDVAGVMGYYIYRDTASLPGGNPAGQESKRINGGSIIGQSGTGTQTLTFDDIMAPPPSINDQFFYRMTVVNSTSDESDMSNELSITIAQHTITTVTQGGGSIGDSVTINGSNFGSSQEATDFVYFTNSSGTTNVEANVTSWTPSQIICDIPYGAADGLVGVQINGVLVLAPTGQEIDYNEPSVTNVAPTQDWVQNLTIVIDGVDFGPDPNGAGTSTDVLFGTTPILLTDIVSWSDTEIQCKVPAAATGLTVSLTVDVAGNVSNGTSFLLLPHIDSISPTSGNTGVTFDVSGTNFGSVQGTGSVTLAGVNCSVNSWANGTVNVTVPAAAVDGAVLLTRDDTQASSLSGFDVIPAITNVSPNRRVEGEQVTITGSGFGATQNGSTVTFNGGGGVVATNIISWGPTTIVCEVPAGASTGTITVHINDASVGSDIDDATSGSNITVILAAPNLTGVGQL
ncbi:MAG: IPT/TIG domain-containing protein [Planctomycetales bacterium]|nr:IPT/TIG domain-containing protein [bacterium]UNM07266.1 MAG: IPT/TIG domain-containing protein [Planctomycetales bacterium]